MNSYWDWESLLDDAPFHHRSVLASPQKISFQLELVRRNIPDFVLQSFQVICSFFGLLGNIAVVNETISLLRIPKIRNWCIEMRLQTDHF